MQHRVAAEPEDVVNAIGFAPTHRFRPAVMAVTANQDAHVGPVLADARDDMFEDRAYLYPVGVLPSRRIIATGLPLVPS